jgi:hypothetical protein
MLGIESYMESFKDSISERFEKQENKFKNLADKMASFEETQIENKKRISRLEDRGRLESGRNPDENDSVELQRVMNFIFIFFRFV